NNGEGVSRDWTDKEQISFTLPINEGTNEIVIHAEDLDGNKASKELTIIGDVGEDGSPIGTATVSMEATTVGRSEEHTSELQSRFDLVCRHVLVNQQLQQGATVMCMPVF